MSSSAKFGARYRRLRRSYGLTLAEIAPGGELTYRDLSGIERGHRRLSEERQQHLWRQLQDAIEQLSNERVDLHELAQLRDGEPWERDEVARSCVRLHPGGLECTQIADLLRLCLRSVEQELASAMRKLRAAAAEQTEEGQAVRQWMLDLAAVQEARDARLSHSEPDADGWEIESETSSDERYSPAREAYPGIPNDVDVKGFATMAHHDAGNTCGYEGGRRA
jgi:hypothetical protein